MSSRELLGLFLGGALYSALAAAFGVGVGAVLRNQIAGIVALLLVLFVAAPTCFPVWIAAVLYAAYTLVLIGAATVLTRRRDIT